MVHWKSQNASTSSTESFNRKLEQTQPLIPLNSIDGLKKTKMKTVKLKRKMQLMLSLIFSRVRILTVRIN